MTGATRIFAVARVEMLRLFRSRMALTLLLVVPALQVALFGFAIRPTAAHVSVAIAAPTAQASDTAAKSLRAQTGLDIVAERLPPGGAAARVRSGGALIGIEVPLLRSFANPMAPVVPLRIIVDASHAGLTGAAVARIESVYWQGLATRAEVQNSGPGLIVERLYNPDARADWTFLPALVGVTVMIAAIMLGALSLAREREGGTWEALLALPVHPAEALIGKLLPYVVLGTVQGGLVLAIAIHGFGLPARGSIVALIVLLPFFTAAHLVLGYAISARAQTQMAALQGAVAFYLPAMLLSGFLYPFATLPDWAQRLGCVFPLTHFIRAAQGALLRGDDAATVLAHGAPILLFLLVALAVALAAHTRRID